MRETAIVLIIWLVATGASGWVAFRSLRTGIAPFQLNKHFGHPLMTRQNSPFAFWYLTAPTIFATVFGAIGIVVMALALLGVFGPLRS